VPGTRLGPYEVTGSLGAGGMGEVYRARNTRLQRDIAIKSCQRYSRPIQSGSRDSNARRMAWYDEEATNRQEVTMRTIARWFLLFGLVAAVPRVAAAQATLAGEVKDTTGAVLPGVTVEAASPALTGKIRTAVTDGSGRYR